MSTIQATYTSQVSVVESSADPFVDPGDPSTTFNGLTESDTLTASSTITATKHASGTKALSSGAGTIDLTAIVNGDGNTITFNTLKLRLAKFLNPSTNANNISITFGAANPYSLSGSDYKVTLAPGQSILFKLDDDAPAVGSSAKNIDISGTGAQPLSFHLVAG